jgi:hypothetical protein
MLISRPILLRMMHVKPNKNQEVHFMKKTIILTLITLAFSTSAFAAALATNTVTTAGFQVFGGADPTTAANATNPLVRFSTGVSGLVNFAVVNTNQSISYAIVTKHTTGSKIFGTSNDSTNIYWKADVAGILDSTKAGALTNNSNFGTAGWTAY